MCVCVCVCVINADAKQENADSHLNLAGIRRTSIFHHLPLTALWHQLSHSIVNWWNCERKTQGNLTESVRRHAGKSPGTVPHQVEPCRPCSLGHNKYHLSTALTYLLLRTTMPGLLLVIRFQFWCFLDVTLNFRAETRVTEGTHVSSMSATILKREAG